ncbi:MAG TPA: hypothetical protein DCF88_05540 [Plesiomonas shigelloides]|uniref:Uncharacterized protein n=1 Tax=Plesiomonas shigelloides 302-73 TaxID=1315976 RepID=R8ASK8_PLESH|nr:hypothetical protein PLESHI_06237 [Plesiomonas shigelloides 302-73]HAD39572.1 hypothetical protein [Plesiomonas shigelloides]HAD41757.1 hypothetical protein [Plesiomonas shigelloides]
MMMLLCVIRLSFRLKNILAETLQPCKSVIALTLKKFCAVLLSDQGKTVWVCKGRRGGGFMSY